jgi:hypothetical protein
MAVGRYVTDLDQGDVLGPLEYTLSRFVVREYCHANELHQPCFQNRDNQFAPPTLVHLDKLRLYKHACPAGTGPTARVHYEYDATIHEAVPVDVPLRVKGTVTQRYEKKGRQYVVMEIELRTAKDDRPLITYRDTVILAYKAAGDAGKGAKA